MNKKYLALILAAIILISTVLTVIVFQSSKQNSTAIADSFELQIKDMIPPNPPNTNIVLNFQRLDNQTLLNQELADLPSSSQYVKSWDNQTSSNQGIVVPKFNTTSVSEKSFLDDVSNLVSKSEGSAYSTITIITCENMFYLLTSYSTAVTCSP